MIEINNLTTLSVEEQFLKKVIQKILEKENKKRVELSVALVGPGRMRKLNKKYRGKNRVTDVLAFPESKVLLEKFKGISPQKIASLGEIVICPRQIKKNAKRFNFSFEKELVKVLIHGILHLLGYNHEKDKEKAEIMEKKEQYYLLKFFPKK